MVEPVALGDGARELVGADRALLDQQPLRRPAGGARRLDRRAGDVVRDVAEVDDDVGDEAAVAAADLRRGQAGSAAGGWIEGRRGGVAGIGDRPQVAREFPRVHVSSSHG